MKNIYKNMLMKRHIMENYNYNLIKVKCVNSAPDFICLENKENDEHLILAYDPSDEELENLINRFENDDLTEYDFSDDWNDYDFRYEGDVVDWEYLA